MINEIEYYVTVGNVTQRLAANKAVNRKNEWHLATLDGNGLPSTSALGNASFGLAGKSYTGISIGSRNMSIKLYCDAQSPFMLQTMLNDARRVVSIGNDALGVLRLKNSIGEWYRIAARCISFDIEQMYSRSALVRLDVDCPYTYFEDDTLTAIPVLSASGGKEYPRNTGLIRPYMFSNSTDASGTTTQTLELVNNGDCSAPFALRVFGAGISRVKLYYPLSASGTTYQAKLLELRNLNSVSGVYLSTDPDNIGAWLSDGTRADTYISLDSDNLADMQIAPGVSMAQLSVTGTTVTVAGTQLEYRGRYSTCL